MADMRNEKGEVVKRQVGILLTPEAGYLLETLVAAKAAELRPIEVSTSAYVELLLWNEAKAKGIAATPEEVAAREHRLAAVAKDRRATGSKKGKGSPASPQPAPAEPEPEMSVEDMIRYDRRIMARKLASMPPRKAKSKKPPPQQTSSASAMIQDAIYEIVIEKSKT